MILTIAVPARTNALFALPWNTNVIYTNMPEYDMPMYQHPHYFHRDLTMIDVGGYQAQYPGPTVRATVGVPLLFNWIHKLPTSYPPWLQANTNFHGVTNQEVRTVVHLHGADTLPRYDGYPTNNFVSGTDDVYLYNNIDLNGDGETLWYHDHVIGVTAINVYSGLEGLYLLTNPEFEALLNLPKGKYEVPLVFQDRDIQATPGSTHSLGDVTYDLPAYFEYIGKAAIGFEASVTRTIRVRRGIGDGMLAEGVLWQHGDPEPIADVSPTSRRFARLPIASEGP